MKITDAELLSLIWINQLKLISREVVCRYMGGKYGMHADDKYWFRSCSSQCRVGRARITSDIGKSQLWVRIKKMLTEGVLATEYPSSLLTFLIDDDQARAAFVDARSFWMGHGVPEGATDKRMNTATGIDFEALASQCETMLLDKYAA